MTDKSRSFIRPNIHREGRETGKIDYIGQTDHLRQRTQQHARLGHLDTETAVFEYDPARPRKREY